VNKLKMRAKVSHSDRSEKCGRIRVNIGALGSSCIYNRIYIFTASNGLGYIGI